MLRRIDSICGVSAPEGRCPVAASDVRRRAAISTATKRMRRFYVTGDLRSARSSGLRFRGRASNIRSGLGRRLAPVGDAIGNTDGAEPAAGDEDAGNRGQQALDCRHALEVANFVLRALLRPPEQPCEERRSLDVE